MAAPALQLVGLFGYGADLAWDRCLVPNMRGAALAQLADVANKARSGQEIGIVMGAKKNMVYCALAVHAYYVMAPVNVTQKGHPAYQRVVDAVGAALRQLVRDILLKLPDDCTASTLREALEELVGQWLVDTVAAIQQVPVIFALFRLCFAATGLL